MTNGSDSVLVNACLISHRICKPEGRGILRQRSIQSKDKFNCPRGVYFYSTTKVIPTASEFETSSESNVKSLIQNSALKSCPLDLMPSRLVSNCDVLLPVITTIKKSSKNRTKLESFRIFGRRRLHVRYLRSLVLILSLRTSDM